MVRLTSWLTPLACAVLLLAGCGGGDSADLTDDTRAAIAGDGDWNAGAITPELEALVAETTDGREAAGRLAGLVLATNGDPLPGAAVVAKGAGVERRGLTDAKGKYLLAGLPPGEYRLACAKEGFLPEQVQGLKVRAGQTRLWTFVLRPRLGAGRLAGLVKNAAGEPVAGARIIARCGLAEVHTLTNRAGEYDLILAPGLYRVGCHKAGYQPAAAEGVRIKPRETTRQPFVLQPDGGS